VGAKYLRNEEVHSSKRKKLASSGENIYLTDGEEKALEVVHRHFRAEFLNRLSDICIFKPLKGKELKQICTNHINSVAARVAPSGITLDIKPEVLDHIVKEAYDPEMGARPLQRFIEHTMITPISKIILSGAASKGSVISVGIRGNRLHFSSSENNSGEAKPDTSKILQRYAYNSDTKISAKQNLLARRDSLGA